MERHQSGYKPTLFSSKGWFENSQRCFSWQKVQLIETSRPAVYLMVDEIPPKLKKPVEEQSHKPSALTVAGHVGGDSYTKETESHEKSHQRRQLEKAMYVYVYQIIMLCNLDIYNYICQLFLNEVGKKGKSW